MNDTSHGHENHELFGENSTNGTAALSAIVRQVAGFSPAHRRGVLDIILGLAVSDWFTPGCMVYLATFRDDTIQWPRILAVAREQYQPRAQLEAAVDAYLAIHPELRGLDQSQAPTSEQDRRQAPRLKVVNAEDLRRMVFPPLRWVIEGLLPAGCTLLTGRAKDGKSMLAWNLCVAVAMGGIALGRERVAQGSVLYLALEDGERRAQQRLNAQLAHIAGQMDLSRLDLVLWDAPRLGEGLEDELVAWIDQHPDARLIVIDILEKVRPRASKSGNIYADAYDATSPLTRIAQDGNIALLVVHHVNKTRPDDVRDSISGPMSLLGGADTFWGLRRGMGAVDATLAIIGRDVPEQELALQFQNGFWTVLGGAEEYQLSTLQRGVLDYLAHEGEPQTPKQIAVALGKLEPSMRVALQRMAANGQVRNLGGGHYAVQSNHISSHDDDVRDGGSPGSMGSPGSGGSLGSLL